MKKKNKITLITAASVLGVVLGVVGVLYMKIAVNREYQADGVEESLSVRIPKSETFKVTSTAKGDNQHKIARIGDDLYTFYLDNSGCSDASARGNDKTMRILQVSDDGTVSEIDAIPVWMHGNLLADPDRNLLFVTTYEETVNGSAFFGMVNVYRYAFAEGGWTRTLDATLADDLSVPNEANPRVGADMDAAGNIAVAFSNYMGVMFVHTRDAVTGQWAHHHIDYYLDTYVGDCTLYPYVRLEGLSRIRLAANRDTSTLSDGTQDDDLARNYTRYFAYENGLWHHWIIADLRASNHADDAATPIDLWFEGENTHLITHEGSALKHYVVTPDEVTTLGEIPPVDAAGLVTFIRAADINGIRYFVVAGSGLQGFKETGYVKIYDASTMKLMYCTNRIPNQPYLYLDKISDGGYLDFEVISRDSKYGENSDSFVFSLRFDR